MVYLCVISVKAISYIFKNYGWRKFALITSTVYGINTILAQSFDYFIQTQVIDAVNVADYRLSDDALFDAAQMDAVVAEVKTKARS